MSITTELKSLCKKTGADLSGVVDLACIKGKLPVIPEDLLDEYLYAVSVGIGLEDKILEKISNRPTGDYAHHCREINDQLNDLSATIAGWLMDKEYKAQAIPASLKVDGDNLLGNISHKAVARMAGLGWQGKSLLLVNKDFGPGLRLTTILTNAPLEPDSPVKNRCGSCTECTTACPAGAIKNTSTESHYKDRKQAIDLEKCHNKLLEFQDLPDIGYTFCGVCIRACPFGKKKSKKR